MGEKATVEGSPIWDAGRGQRSGANSQEEESEPELPARGANKSETAEETCETESLRVEDEGKEGSHDSEAEGVSSKKRKGKSTQGIKRKREVEPKSRMQRRKA